MIYILDALCGSGKSTSMLKSIEENLEDKWLFITPFLSEIEDRLPRELPQANFKCPESKRGSKLSDIKKLLSKGENISATHALFKLLDKEAVEIILENNYQIVIDEAVDAISEYKEGLNRADIHALLTGDFITIDPDSRNRIRWNEEKYPEHDGKYSEVRKVCENSMLYVYNNTFLMCEYPPGLLARVKNCYVLTYMFKTSSMRYWLDINDIEYQYIDHRIAGLRDEEDIKRDIRDNLQIVSNRKLDKLQASQREGTFSKRWFSNARPEALKAYKAVMRSCMVANQVNGSDIFWTTYKQYRGRLMATGFNYNHLPLNIKATNDYKDRSFCVYAANTYPNVTDGNYISSLGVEISQEDKDMFTLSNLLQFMFRGTIRDKKPMKILILSKRVRKLLENWLEK